MSHKATERMVKEKEQFLDAMANKMMTRSEAAFSIHRTDQTITKWRKNDWQFKNAMIVISVEACCCQGVGLPYQLLHRSTTKATVRA